jgi:histidine phosphotransferase ChpT
MPLGGEIHVRRIATGWEVLAEGEKMSVDEALWTGMLGRVRPQVTAAQVQFALLPQALATLGKVLALKLALGRIVARF